jgi:hypothetical protein
MFAGGKVVFVVAAHLRRETGNIISPASEDFPHYGINALTHKKLKADSFCGRTLRRQHDPIVQ